MTNPGSLSNQQVHDLLAPPSRTSDEDFKVVLTAWQATPEFAQRDVIYRVWRAHQEVFIRWLGHLGRGTGSFRAEKIARNPRQYQAQLVSALGKCRGCARQVLETYFTEGRPEANDAFNAHMRKLGLTKENTNVEVAREALAVARLKAREGTPELFEAALRWIAAEWFQSPDLESINGSGTSRGAGVNPTESDSAVDLSEDGVSVPPSTGKQKDSSGNEANVFLPKLDQVDTSELPDSPVVSPDDAVVPANRLLRHQRCKAVPALVSLWEEYEKVRAIQSSLREAIETCNWEIEGLLAQVREQERTIDRCELKVRTELGTESLRLAKLDLSAEPEGVSLWLEKAANAYLRRDDRAREDLEKAKLTFLAECERLGVKTPSSAETATTREALDASRLEVEPALALERAFRSLRNGGDRSGVFQLQSSQRASLYSRLEAEAAGDWSAARILDLWATDSEAASECDLARPSVTSLLRAALRGNEKLPTGTWLLWVSLWGEEAGVQLHRADIAELAGSHLIDSSEGDELIAAFDEISSLPAPIARTIALQKTKRLPTEASIQALARLSNEWSGSVDVRQELLDALLRAGRWGEGLLVATIGIRQGWLNSLDRSHTNAIFGLVLANPQPDGVDGVMREMFDDPSSLASQPEDILLYLGVALTCRRADLATTCRYGNPKLFLKAKERWPALISLLLSILEGPDVHARREADVARANKLRREFEHDLRRPSAYANWRPHGMRYQDHFRSYLEDKYRSLRADRELALLEPEEILDRAQRTGLPHAQGNGRVAMLDYLRSQIERLDNLAALAQTFLSWPALEEAILFQSETRRAELDELVHNLVRPTPLELLIPHLERLVSPTKPEEGGPDA